MQNVMWKRLKWLYITKLLQIEHVELLRASVRQTADNSLDRIALRTNKIALK